MKIAHDIQKDQGNCMLVGVLGSDKQKFNLSLQYLLSCYLNDCNAGEYIINA